MSWYLTIRPDPSYTRSTPAGPLVEHLRAMPELVQAGPLEFRNAPDSPWVSLILAWADGSGNYAAGAATPAMINVVELVCGEGDEYWYESLAGRVAAFLGWEVVGEHGRRIIYRAG